MKSEEKITIYGTVLVSGKKWDECEQIFLGYDYWSAAVKWAKDQKKPVRLCTSPGYCNNGHYFNERPAIL